MITTPEIFIRWVWSAWVISWIAAAVWSDPAVKRPGFERELGYRLFAILGAGLIFWLPPRRLHADWVVFWTPLPWKGSAPIGWALAALTVAGIAFMWWARIHLGRLWSGAVTRKAGHHIVDSGPYGLVRHPIYTGIIFALVATAVLNATVPAIVGAGCAWLGLYLKAKLEERFLREELGPEQYDAYARRVPMLVPRFG